MIDFIKNIFSTPQPKRYPLGSIPNEPDVRDIAFEMVHTPVALDELPLNYLSEDIYQFDQGQLGTCSAQAFVWLKMLLDKIETGELAIYSRRFLYALTRQFLGYFNTNEENNQGLPSRETAKVLTTVGTVKDTGQDNNTLPHAVYVNSYVITPAMRTEANLYRSGGFAFPTLTTIGLQQAVYKAKAIAVSIWIDWDCIDPDGTVHPPKKADGGHEVDIRGWEYNYGRPRFVFKNWWPGWGTNGNGYINFDEMKDVVYDAIALTDIPNDLIERAKTMQYIFLTDLKLGTVSPAVVQLQNRLRDYHLFSYMSSTGFFGPLTFEAVRSYQKLKGLPVTGYFGPLTRAMMNLDAGTPGTTKSKIDLWCEGIIQMEGAKPEICNPGNIRWVAGTIPTNYAIGKDSRGFCIFPDYATGYMQLRNLLVRACTGQSSSYSPTMTLYQFYEKYAPSSDGNYPRSYAETVAAHINVPPTTVISTLL